MAFIGCPGPHVHVTGRLRAPPACVLQALLPAVPLPLLFVAILQFAVAWRHHRNRKLLFSAITDTVGKNKWPPLPLMCVTEAAAGQYITGTFNPFPSHPMLLRLPLHFIDTPCLISFSTPSLTKSCAHHLLVLQQGIKKGCSHYSNTTLPPADPPSPGRSSKAASASDAASVAHLYTPPSSRQPFAV